NNTVGMGDAGIKSAIQGSNVPNPDEAVPSFVSGAMAKAGKGLLEGTLQAGTSAVSDKLLDLVGLGGKSAADKDRKSGSAGMPRPISYAVFCLKKKKTKPLAKGTYVIMEAKLMLAVMPLTGLATGVKTPARRMLRAVSI